MGTETSKRAILLGMLAAALGNIIWGFSSMCSRICMEVTTPAILLFWRFAIAAAAMFLFARVRHISVRPRRGDWKWILLLSLFQPIVYFIGEEYGILCSSTAFCGVILALAPVMGLVQGMIFLHERASIWQVLFSLLSIAGVIILTIASGGTGVATVSGALLFVMAVAAGSAYFVVGRHVKDSLSAFQRTFYLAVSGCAAFFVWALLENLRNPMAILQAVTVPRFVWPVVYLGIVSTILAYFLVNYATVRLPAARFMAFCNLSTILTVLCGMLILKEPYVPALIPTTVMILVGVWGVQKYTPEYLEAHRK